MAETTKRYSIGYALAAKKQHSFIQTSLLNLAKDRGIDLVKIDPNFALIYQGPFDCIIHKIPGEDWIHQLEDYKTQKPNVVVIDHPESIERLHNRISMLQVVSELGNLGNYEETFGVPKQIVIYNPEELLGVDPMQGLKFPVIAKPLVADGSAKSHKMSLIFNRDGLKKLKPPAVLQEFVNHGGVIFKVYVVGDHVTCVKRKSLPDVSEEKLRTLGGSLSFSQISNLPTHERAEDVETTHLDQMEMPPLSFITDIARGLGKAMRLHLFNFDVIRDVKVGSHYLVIDINYFPGYAKMPDYEAVLTDFFLDIAASKLDDGKRSPGIDCSKTVNCEDGKDHVNNTFGDENEGSPKDNSIQV
ncbi:hypothetical protein GIB67_001997 [Kingdonia uniflora]|uniref:Inositol-tetrakisphosphate 1-kinase n=1 Tax=Kingdonia uniflora TaxID=39325 RepID=A0A7J7MAB2_9MAGN|nr:hypothetical protein GIB67_001997 [Kingdonia uniflora]